MTETPLYTALMEFHQSGPVRFHMPGHHGKSLFPTPIRPELDVTELPPTGNLYEPGGPIEAAEALWALAVGMPRCLFLTGGSTQGNHAALTLACRPGDPVLLDRGSHRSLYHAMALLDLRPVYLPRPWLDEAGVAGPIDPRTVENLLQSNPKVKTVCITSPTYYGVLSDITAIAEVVHARGGTLVVDGAHGAHLPFLGETSHQAADLVVVSAHKTLPAPGQTALLFSGDRYGQEALRWAGAIHGSSSPSYPMMAALDLCRAYLEGEGRAAYGRTAAAVRGLRERWPSLSEKYAHLDPTRFVLNAAGGRAAKQRLESLGVYPEMADAGHVVFILTCADGEEELARLERALAALEPGVEAGARPVPPPPAFPELVLTPRQALFAPRVPMPLEEAEGRVSAVQVAPYPPGIPVIAPGERVEKKHLSYLTEIGYNIKDTMGVL